jgi:hypothetical protein
VEKNAGRLYQIKLRGGLDEDWSNWLGGLTIQQGAEADGRLCTLLTGRAVDPPALFGVLERIRDLNLDLISVVCVEE